MDWEDKQKAEEAYQEMIKKEATYGKWNMDAFPKDDDSFSVTPSQKSSNNTKSGLGCCLLILAIPLAISLWMIIIALFNIQL